MKHSKTGSTVEITFKDLCRQVDYYKGEAQYWKEKFEEEKNKHNLFLNEQLLQAKKGVAQALSFALHVTDDENGNLVIPAEKRKELAEQYK